jgi:hypothetical protein
MRLWISFIEGKSTERVMGHVRAGLDVVEEEITSGFKSFGESPFG